MWKWLSLQLLLMIIWYTHKIQRSSRWYLMVGITNAIIGLWRTTFFILKFFELGVQTCSGLGMRWNYSVFKSTFASVASWNYRNFCYTSVGEQCTMRECQLMLRITESFKLGKTLKIIKCNHKAVAPCQGYTIWTKRSVNINGYPLWENTFAHRVGYHTKSVERLGQGVSPMR